MNPSEEKEPAPLEVKRDKMALLKKEDKDKCQELVDRLHKASA